MQHLFVLAELLYEFLDAVFVKEFFFLRRIDALVGKRDFETGIKKCQFAQPRCETLEFKLRRNCENRRVRKEGNQCTGGLFVFDLTDNCEFVGCLALGESHVIDLAVTRDFRLEPFRERVRAFSAYAVQAAGIFVGALSKFSAGVQICEYQLDCRHFPLGVNIHGSSTSVVTHRERSIDMDGHFYFCTKASEMFIDRIVQHLENQMVQTPLIGIANEHSRPLSNRFETF